MKPSKVIDEAKIVIAINSDATANIFVDGKQAFVTDLFVYGTPQNIIVRMNRVLKDNRGRIEVDNRKKKPIIMIDEFAFFEGGVEATTYKQEGEQ